MIHPSISRTGVVIKLAMTQLVLSFLVLICGLHATAPAEAAEKSGRIRYDSLACNSRQDARKYFDLYLKRREAAREFETAHIAAGDCRMLRRSTEVMIQRNTWSGRSICVRPSGLSSCLWIYRGWIIKH